MQGMKFVSWLLLFPAMISAAPIVIDDAALVSSFQQGIGAFADSGEHPEASAFSEQVGKAPATAAIGPLDHPAAEHPADAVFLVGSVYKCGKCEHWHPGGIATAWALTPDGLMVTNHHVFENAKGAAMGVCDRNGRTYPITGVVAADKTGDVALFRVKAAGLPVLRLGPDADVGETVRVLSHPQKNFYMQTSGEVARYYRSPGKNDEPGTVWMSITADYAKGSSGGPVLNARNEVVGMVSSTRSIYYDSPNGKPKGPLQMVLKNCVPVSAIRPMLGNKSRGPSTNIEGDARHTGNASPLLNRGPNHP